MVYTLTQNSKHKSTQRCVVKPCIPFIPFVEIGIFINVCLITLFIINKAMHIVSYFFESIPVGVIK